MKRIIMIFALIFSGCLYGSDIRWDCFEQTGGSFEYLGFEHSGVNPVIMPTLDIQVTMNKGEGYKGSDPIAWVREGSLHGFRNYDILCA